MAGKSDDVQFAEPVTASSAGEIRLCLAGEPVADELLSRDPFALVVGMVLDQQFPLERAFAGPRTILERLGADSPDVDRLDVHLIAEMEPARFAEICARTPAVHRFPSSMAARIQAAAAHVIAVWDGDVRALWESADSGTQLRARLRALPGFGEQKARIFLALLAKQCGVTPPGWREAAEPYGTPGSRRSVADITDAATLAEVRAHKRLMRAEREQRGTSARDPEPIELVDERSEEHKQELKRAAKAAGAG